MPYIVDAAFGIGARTVNVHFGSRGGATHLGLVFVEFGLADLLETLLAAVNEIVVDTVEIARPSSGAYERMPLVQIDELDLLATLKRRGMRIVGCLASARRSIQAVNLARPTMLAIGGEKRGLSGKCREFCDRFATIPTRGGPSSLSLSHAAAIVLFEAHRQRCSLASEQRIPNSG